MSEGRVRLAVLAGGAIGTLGRWLAGTSVPEAGPGWGWSTLTVNITGALAMGMLVAWLSTRVSAPLLRPFAAVGLLGGWTTYSTFALDAHTIIVGHGVGSALSYVVATLVLGVCASLAGLLLGGRWFGTTLEAGEHIADEEEL